MNAEEINWGLVGASTIAAEHMLPAIRSLPGHKVVALCSSNEQRAAAFAGQHSIAAVHTSLDRLLADSAVHAVYISTTNERHRDEVLAAAAAGKHVLCEKPLALTTEDALAMVKACRDAGVVLGTNHHLRNSAVHRRMRDLIRAGAIGRPLFARVFHAVHLPRHLQGWRINRPDAGGGVVLDIAVHDIDSLRFLLDAEPVETVAMPHLGGLAQAGLEDGAMSIVRFDNGVLAQMHDAFTVPFAGTGLEVHGDAGSLIGRDVMTQRPVGELVLRNAGGEQIQKVDHEDLYVAGVRAFAEAIRARGQPAATGQDGVRSVNSALAIAEACRYGRSVAISNPIQELS